MAPSAPIDLSLQRDDEEARPLAKAAIEELNHGLSSPQDIRP